MLTSGEREREEERREKKSHALSPSALTSDRGVGGWLLAVSLCVWLFCMLAVQLMTDCELLYCAAYSNSV